MQRIIQRGLDKRLANLKPFARGVSGNPNGRPKKTKLIPDMLREISQQPVSDWLLADLHRKYGPDHNPKTMGEAVILAAMVDAARGDKDARSFFSERTEGKVPQAQVNTNFNADVADMTKMPLADILQLAQDLQP